MQTPESVASIAPGSGGQGPGWASYCKSVPITANPEEEQSQEGTHAPKLVETVGCSRQSTCPTHKSPSCHETPSQPCRAPPNTRLAPGAPPSLEQEDGRLAEAAP